MIVSHKHKFIFVRTEKTAGTSVSSALLEFLGEGDVVANMKRPGWARYSPIHHGALKRHFPAYFGLHTHATIGQVRRVLGEDVYARYFKFCIERNPWDRQVSLYFHREKIKDKLATANFDRDMSSLVYRWTEYTRLYNWQIYTINNRIAVDQVIRYEDLDTALPKLLSQLGIPASVSLPRRRSGYRDRDRHYREHYSDRTRDLVARWYQREIGALGYEF